MVDFGALEALCGPRAPDPDLAQFHVTAKHGILNVSLHVCKNMNIGTNAMQTASLNKSMEPSKIT